MNDDPFADVRQYEYMPSRIPALDALSMFVPDNEEPPPALREMTERLGTSRWYPKPGGHLVMVPYERQPYDATLFTRIEKGWDHEHCCVCRENIASMTLCWVTTPGNPYILLCVSCRREMDGVEPAPDV